MIFLRQTFTIAYNWDNTWDKYKSANFWEIKVPEIEVTVQNIYKMLSSSLKLLKDESWKMLEIRRDSVDAFRRVLPLISDLKNPAMRNRHWDEVREAMNKLVDLIVISSNKSTHLKVDKISIDILMKLIPVLL